MKKKSAKSGFYGRLVDAIEAKEKRTITQDEIGYLVGVKQAAVSKWKRGGLPTTDRLAALAVQLNVTVDWLLTDRQPRRPGGEIEGEQAELLSLYVADVTFQHLVRHWHVLEPPGRMSVLKSARYERATQYTGDELRQLEVEEEIANKTRKAKIPAK